MRLTIEWLRTMTLAAGVLLIAALVVFLAMGKWKKSFTRDLPRHLGAGVEQEASGFTRVEFHAGHKMYKIHALRARTLTNNHVLLHDVDIEMYGSDDGSVDRIKGNEFEWDDNRKTATAMGQVEITISRPRGAPARGPGGAPAGKQTSSAPQPTGAPPALQVIQLETQGLTFEQATGIAKTSEKVAFSLAQGSGTAVGATYDSQQGKLVLDREVELNTHRGPDPVHLHAGHAEMERDDQLCRLTMATAEYRGGNARAEKAAIHYREDGSAEQLDAAGNVALATETGGRLTAPAGTIQFDAKNQPVHGDLEGGVIVDSDTENRQMHGTAPSADLQFAAGVLHRAHLERNVTMSADERSQSDGVVTTTHRIWNSPVADLEFRTVGNGQAELNSIHGIGGVVVTGESRRGNGPESPSRLAADDVTATFGENAELKTLLGVGHSSVTDTTPAGARQTTTGDRLDAQFAPQGAGNRSPQVQGAGSAQIEKATVYGHVLIVQQPGAKPGQPPPPELRAIGERAVYEGAGQWVHLTGEPRVVNGGLQLTADKLDMSQASNTTFAHGNVKASWFGNTQQPAATGSKSADNKAGPGLGGDGPAHVIAAEAEMHQDTGEATFRGQARLWQQGNSVAAPVIVLNRTRQTLAASTTNSAVPVRVVLVNTSTNPEAGKSANPDQPSVIRVRGGEFTYADAERKAVMLPGVMSRVVAETTEAITHSDEADVILLPAEKDATQGNAGSRVDRMTARGHVTLDSEGRNGTGEQLVYSGKTGEYTLTGTSATPPRIVDPARGTVTGEALIFNNRDDSVIVEGGKPKTATETTAPKRL